MQQNFDNTKITVEFDEAGNRQQLSSGDSLKTLFGKIKKWFFDLKPVAFSGDYNDLSGKPTIPDDYFNPSEIKSNLVPNENSKYNIGSIDSFFDTVYSRNFFIRCGASNSPAMINAYTSTYSNSARLNIGRGLIGNSTLQVGHFSKYTLEGPGEGTEGTAFVIGNGTNNILNNAFQVDYDGSVYSNTTKLTGADYSEYLEWKDKNTDEEDRVGRFVTLVEDKIVIANSGDFIIGVISGNPSVIGNDDFGKWHSKYLKDDFGRYVLGDVDIVNDYGETQTLHNQLQINEEFDDTLVYIPRQNRAEWDTVGMLGVLRVYDDGTCYADGWCKVSENGIATAANINDYTFTTPIFKVMKRISENVIMIFFK